jgi:hypothetical protein
MQPDASVIDSMLVGQCPVCQRNCGHKQPRHALIKHIKRSCEPQHVIWREQYWKMCFPHGKYRCSPLDSADMPRKIVCAVEKAYGNDMIPRLKDHLISLSSE